MSFSTSSTSNMKSFFVNYTGWSPTDGIYGNEFVLPVFNHIIQTRMKQNNFEPERLQLKVLKEQIRVLKEIKLTKMSAPVFTDYPNIPIADITYCSRHQYDNKSFLCLIVLGYDTHTGVPIHVYVYELANDMEADTLHYLIIKRINKDNFKERIIKIEDLLLGEGKVKLSKFRELAKQLPTPVNLYRNGSTGSSLNSSINSSNGKNERSYSLATHLRSESDNINLNSSLNYSNDIKLRPKANSNVARSKSEFIKKPMNTNDIQDNKKHFVTELQNKLESKKPLLLPPRDYDTIHRKFGKTQIDVNRLPNSHLPFSEMDNQTQL